MNSIPRESIEIIINYLLVDEERHYLESLEVFELQPKDSKEYHIYEHLIKVKHWLKEVNA